MTGKKANLVQKVGAIVALSVVGFSGCDLDDTYIEGEVINVVGNVTSLERSSGAFFGNESVRLDTNYVLQVKTKEGIYTMKVESSYNKPVEALALLIEKGSKIKFLKKQGFIKDLFSSDKIGTLPSNDIEILDK